MSSFNCPHCGTEVDADDIPDHISNSGPSGRFTFECDCGCTFEVAVDWDPSFYVLRDTVKSPAASPSTDP